MSRLNNAIVEIVPNKHAQSLVDTFNTNSKEFRLFFRPHTVQGGYTMIEVEYKGRLSHGDSHGIYMWIKGYLAAKSEVI
jgi:hypothetical protein